MFRKLTFPRDITKRIQQKGSLVLILFCLYHCVAGQDSICQKYENAYNTLLTLRNTLPINYAQHQLHSNETASYLELCLKDRINRGVVTDTEFVETTYMIGKLFRDGGKCDLAYNYFLKCMANTMSERLKPNYYDLANVLKNTCIVPDIHADAHGDNYRVRISNYAGKGGLIRNYFLNDIDLNNLTDNTPYLSNEIETLASRKFWLADTTNAISQLKDVSGATYYLYKKPFLLLLVTGKVYQDIEYPKLSDVDEQDGDIRVANDDQYGRDASVDYLDKFYQNLIAPAYEKFTGEYFDRFSTDDIIPIFIFDHPFNAEGAMLYAKFTEKIHFRKAAGKVGYYNHFDGSLVTWINSGGGTFIHEFVHLLMDHDANTEQIPYWLNEGMASLYEETNNFRPMNNWRLVYIKKCMEIYNSFASIEGMLSLDDFRDEYQQLMVDAYSRYLCMYLYDRGLLDDIYKNIRKSVTMPNNNQQIVLIESACGQQLDSVQQEFGCWIRDNDDFGSWNFEDYTNEVAEYVSQKGQFPLNVANVDFNDCPVKKTATQPAIIFEYDEKYPEQHTEPVQNQMQLPYSNQPNNIPNQQFNPSQQEQNQMQQRLLQPEDSVNHQ